MSPPIANSTTAFFMCNLGCKRIHMRNSFLLSQLTNSLNVSITVENLAACIKADVNDVIELMLLELKQGQKVGFHITGEADNIKTAKDQIREIIRHE